MSDGRKFTDWEPVREIIAVPTHDDPDATAEGAIAYYVRYPSDMPTGCRFRVVREEWTEEPGPSAHNPGGLPERTVISWEPSSTTVRPQ